MMSQRTGLPRFVMSLLRILAGKPRVPPSLKDVELLGTILASPNLTLEKPWLVGLPL